MLTVYYSWQERGDIIELSQIAHEYHSEFGYQEYIEWVKEDLKLSETYGRNLLNVFQNFGVTAQSAVEQISSSALRLLSAPSTPESAREEVIERAEAGETVTHAKALHVQGFDIFQKRIIFVFKFQQHIVL